MLLQLVQSSHTPSCLKARAFNTHSKSYPTQILLQATMRNPHNFRQLNQIKEYKNNYLLLGHRSSMAYIQTQPSLLQKLLAMGKVSTRPSKPAGPGTVHRHSGLDKPDPFKLTTGSPLSNFPGWKREMSSPLQSRSLMTAQANCLRTWSCYLT